VVPGRDVVAGEEEHVARAERGGAEQVRLQREPVAVAARQLHDGRDAAPGDESAHRERRDVRVRRGIVGAVRGVDDSAERLGEPAHFARVRAVRGLHLDGDRELARAQQRLETAVRRARRRAHPCGAVEAPPSETAHAAGAIRSRPVAAFAQDEVPCRRQSTGGWRRSM